MSTADRPTPKARRGDPGIHPVRRTIRYWLARAVVAAVSRAWVRYTVEGREYLPAQPAIYCFNHLSWADPFVLMATLPMRPRLFFFGPKEEDMGVGGKNRLVHWTGMSIPYKPGKNDLLEATRRVATVIGEGGIVAVPGEGRIGALETALLPLSEGPAYFALRSHLPLIPIAINGTSSLGFGTRIRVRIGAPIEATGRPDRATIAATTAVLHERLEALLADPPAAATPGRIGAWLTEVFNDWPEGSREAALDAQLAGRATAPDGV